MHIHLIFFEMAWISTTFYVKLPHIDRWDSKNNFSERLYFWNKLLPLIQHHVISSEHSCVTLLFFIPNWYVLFSFGKRKNKWWQIIKPMSSCLWNLMVDILKSKYDSSTIMSHLFYLFLISLALFLFFLIHHPTPNLYLNL